jgi:hypothetical protein
MKESIINAIINEKINEIKELKDESKAKDIQINNLKMIEGELTSKEKTISVLNRENYTLK